MRAFFRSNIRADHRLADNSAVGEWLAPLRDQA
jgi:hypothetical protein